MDGVAREPAEVGVRHALGLGRAAAFYRAVEGGGDEGLQDEEVDGHVAVEGELEARNNSQ